MTGEPCPEAAHGGLIAHAIERVVLAAVALGSHLGAAVYAHTIRALAGSAPRTAGLVGCALAVLLRAVGFLIVLA
mgnify:CR=1 FL=1